MPTPLDRLDPERRAALVRAAADEFASAGLEGASLNRIIRACGMSKSSFYHLFDAKQDLVVLVIGDLTEQVRSGLEVPAPDSFAEKFWEVTEEFLSRLERDLVAHPDALLLGRLFYAAPPEGAQTGVVAEISAWVAQVLQIGREVGAVRTDLPAELQLGLVVAVLRTMDQWAVQALADEGTTAGLEVDVVLDALRRLLAP
ncbi:TetR/AcrR family transcriptional regulator [Ruania alba]|uniref:DNA-binding transcriptional regulator, AcrR family n=1 Tax=Ruania alba TaxID=648782 RepID=A0A1H5KMD2_9MICO|nr:TetR/AcrR family transcriptional regulator [Ruania alba]SEE65784.1 DNA-binding transcriptional regulator, AcrR family [Ruania alba]